MKLAKKLIIFLVVFSFLFYFIRTSDEYNTEILLADLGGVTWFYSVIGTIFGMLAAFVIQKEWNEWNALTDAVRGEVDGLEKLYLWSSNFPQQIKVRIHANIRTYLNLLIREKWIHCARGERSPKIEAVISELNGNIYHIFDEAPELMPTSFALLSKVLDHRSTRLQHSSEHMPPLLKNTLQFAAFLLIGLSVFIGVKNIWLAFFFTAGIASLAYSIFLVLLDLDNPLQPGDWHISTKDYEALLQRISNSD